MAGSVLILLLSLMAAKPAKATPKTGTVSVNELRGKKIKKPHRAGSPDRPVSVQDYMYRLLFPQSNR